MNVSRHLLTLIQYRDTRLERAGAFPCHEIRKCPINVCFAVLLWMATPALNGQHEHPPGDPGELGQVQFAVSCEEAAQEEFNRGVAILHSFWYEEAPKAFLAAAEKDPDCAMSYWGVAMSYYHPLWYPPSEADLKAGWAAVDQAKRAGAKTDREADYIAAIETFYGDWERQDHLSRVLAYEGAMEQLSNRYPDDREAAIFYALALQGTATALPPDKTYTRQKKSGAILEKVFAEQPEHPGVTHYIIHAFDYPELADRALTAARKYAKIAPSSPHALHMPSHIFTRLGLWEESIQSNLASAAASVAYAARHYPGATYWEELHANDYLVYAYLQRTQDRKAAEIAGNLPTIRQVKPETFGAAYALAAMPARYVMERRRWSEALALELHPDFLWSESPWAEGILDLARGLGAARTGDVAAARQYAEQLKNLHETLAAVKSDWWTTQVEIQYLMVAAWLAHAENKDEEAITQMRAAADLDDATGKHPVTPGPLLPARELLGDLLLELNQPAEAMKEYEIALQNSPNRFNGLYGAGRAAELLGQHEKAEEFYSQLLALSADGDGDRPELLTARAFLGRIQ